MACTPKTPASAVCAALTTIVRVETFKPLAMERSTMFSNAVTEEAKMPVASAIQQIVANRDSADGCMFSADAKALDYRGRSELQPDLFWQSTEGDTTHKAKKHQVDTKAKDLRSSTSRQSKRGRPKMTNGRRGG